MVWFKLQLLLFCSGAGFGLYSNPGVIAGSVIGLGLCFLCDIVTGVGSRVATRSPNRRPGHRVPLNRGGVAYFSVALLGLGGVALFGLILFRGLQGMENSGRAMVSLGVLCMLITLLAGTSVETELRLPRWLPLSLLITSSAACVIAGVGIPLLYWITSEQLLRLVLFEMLVLGSAGLLVGRYWWKFRVRRRPANT